MLTLLSSGRKYSKKEIAEYLDTNDRNIYELKKEIEDAGYLFEDLKGRYGGYALSREGLMCIPRYSEDEEKAVIDLANRINLDSEVINQKITNEVLNKMTALLKMQKADNHIYVSNERKVIDKNQLDQNYNILKNAIKNNNKIRCEYSSYSRTRERILNPYDLALINGKWYAVCFDVEDQLFKTLKINRFSNVSILESKFWIDPSYKLSNFVDNNGLVNIGDDVRLTLKISGAYMKDLMENNIGSDVHIENYGSFIIYHAIMRGEYKIKHFVMSMGQDCIVVEPEALKLEIMNEIKTMLAIYKELTSHGGNCE